MVKSAGSGLLSDFTPSYVARTPGPPNAWSLLLRTKQRTPYFAILVVIKTGPPAARAISSSRPAAVREWGLPADPLEPRGGVPLHEDLPFASWHGDNFSHQRRRRASDRRSESGHSAAPGRWNPRPHPHLSGTLSTLPCRLPIMPALVNVKQEPGPSAAAYPHFPRGSWLGRWKGCDSRRRPPLLFPEGTGASFSSMVVLVKFSVATDRECASPAVQVVPR